MEITIICVAALVISFLLMGNSPMQMSREAWGITLATVLFTVIGGASFFGQIIHATLPQLQQTRNTLENYLEHRPGDFYQGWPKFRAHDRFHHNYGICCGQEGHCMFCVDLQAEELQALVRMRQTAFERRMEEAFAKYKERGVDS
ncbi:uncharacterized protein BKA55DRAFT_534250 [Fusarium redolens]|uniref:Uncharacterized protein n=1 Tax=Fusarium redolens TaxID=48865 RepID=A0A9P9R6Y5_FUSRE|nr:uncharacterized protein BKA55DRAFT_534250 [Fusarium redolens]KAH7267475.1 hypothetical protein BKA55DRAFT_534250 [Fusarium redolens]